MLSPLKFPETSVGDAKARKELAAEEIDAQVAGDSVVAWYVALAI